MPPPLLQPVDYVGGPLSVQNMPGVGPHGQMRLGKSPPGAAPQVGAVNHPISDLRRQVHQRVVAGGGFRENSIQRRAPDGPVYECLPQGLVVHQVAPAAVDQDGVGFIRARKAPSTIMLMLMALRFGIPGHNAVIQGQQIQMKQKAIAAHAPGLFQCAVGLVGFGDTAQATARRLASFGCKLYYSPATAVRLR